MGVEYLTMCWGKHKYVAGTPQEDKYIAYKFGEFGILDDINGVDTGVRDIYDAGSGSGTDSENATKEGELVLF